MRAMVASSRGSAAVDGEVVEAGGFDVLDVGGELGGACGEGGALLAEGFGLVAEGAEAGVEGGHGCAQGRRLLR